MQASEHTNFCSKHIETQKWKKNIQKNKLQINLPTMPLKNKIIYTTIAPITTPMTNERPEELMTTNSLKNKINVMEN